MQKPGQGRQQSYYLATFKGRYGSDALPIVKTGYRYKLTHKYPIKLLLQSWSRDLQLS